MTWRHTSLLFPVYPWIFQTAMALTTLSKRLRAARINKGLSQRELATRAGMEQSQISRIEKGEKGASVENLAALARELGTTVSYLVGDEHQAIRYDYDAENHARLILADYDAPQGLRDLAGDRALVEALKINEAEWEALRSIKLPSPATKDGYVNLLIAVRVVAPQTPGVTRS
jgi:transcriptional regulator with XRE-family HTH domain